VGATTDVTDLDSARPTVETEVHAALELIQELHAYNRWIFRRIRPFLTGTVCEVGCGIGNMTRFLLGQERVVGIEPLGISVLRARERFADQPNVSIIQRSLEECPNPDVPAGGFDTVICLNVLEHLEDDVHSLRRMGELCRGGGRVVILVPAHMSAYGEMDRYYGHWRRYNRRSLGRAFREAGLSVGRSFYMNALGYFGWLWHGRIFPCQKIPSSSARLVNRLAPFLAAFERFIPPPFGQSLIMVGAPQ